MPQIVDEQDVSTDLDAQIREALCICFPKDEPVFSHTRAWHGSSPAFSAVCQEDQRLVAHVGVVGRRLTVGDTWLLAGGVQNVLVLPDCRGRGLVDEVMAACMREAGHRGYDCGLLFCIPELEKIYQRCGWRTVSERPVVRVENGQELPLPGRNIAMFYPLRVAHFPAGVIHLQGNDW